MTPPNGRQKSIFRDLYYYPYMSGCHRRSLFSHSKDDLGMVQRFGLVKRLPIHQGCVNTISWNATGEYLLSGSDDQRLIITHGHSYRVLKDYHTRHNANIFSAKFLPETGDQKIVSCSGDGLLLYTDINEPEDQSDGLFNCHFGTTYEVITVPHDPHSFLSCGEDGTVRWFDLRVKSKCNKPRCREDIIISTSRAITALALNPNEPHLAVACSDSSVQIFDRRFLSAHIGEPCQPRPFCTFTAPELDDRPYRITSLNYSDDGQNVLVSYSSEHLYLFEVKKQATTPLKKQTSKTAGSCCQDKIKSLTSRDARSLPIRRLRLRGDWSDTGPDARPESDTSGVTGIGQARPHLHSTLMQRMTDVLSRMLNDPLTRAALNAGGEDSLDDEQQQQAQEAQQQEQRSSGVDSSNRSNEPMLVDPERNTSEGRNSEEDVEMDETTDNSALDSRSSQLDTLQDQASSSTVAVNADSSANAPAPAVQHKSAIATHLRNHLNTLRSLRHGFIEQHGLEPSVSLKYSEESTSTSTISLRLGVETSNASAATASSGSADSTASQPSTSSSGEENGGAGNTAKEMSDVEVDYDSDDDDADSITVSEPAFAAQTHISHIKAKYVGHRNARTMIKEATFWGDDHVMSGSDCGHIFVWNRHTAKLEMLLQADQHVVNCLQPHPTLPILASSGIDHDIKLWMPNRETSSFDAEWAENLVKRNAVMLEETRDTITVPAAFMIRMLACLNQIRRGNRRRARPANTTTEESA